ncbi:uncharacterized protein LOC133813976 [Humulus lupulus]|uniref:uncharacterized protein LOC133813976 n=1 Tax=Humulus lupulus TaxID=3486 RepID=UPI002B40DAE7|nr:uncharacterized protein LOC133813976 [Humulus lupulus]
MDELMGIEAIDFSDDQEETHENILTPQETETKLQRRSKIRMQFSKIMSSATNSKGIIGTSSSPSQFQANLAEIRVDLGESVRKVIPKLGLSGDLVKIEEEDIEDEVSFWNSSMVCWVWGANPQIQVMDGFFKRIWRTSGVDKIGLLKHGLFIVRFTSMESRDKVLAGGYPLFDKKPLMLKAWDPNVCIQKDDIRSIPIWIQVHNLDLKYWGARSLFKIVGQIGKPIREDSATKNRDRLQFARVMVEVSESQAFPSSISFVNEKSEMIRLDIFYEWKPTFCSICKGMGHENTDCRKQQQNTTHVTTVWKPKNDVSMSEEQNKENTPGLEISGNLGLGNTNDTTTKEQSIDKEGF